MSMTHLEASERAKKIWTSGVQQVELDRGGADICVNNQWHSLDGNGHVTCHSKCEELEEKAFGQAPILERASVLESTPDPKAQVLQLLREAVSLLDTDDPNHDTIDLRDWLRSARQVLSA